MCTWLKDIFWAVCPFPTIKSQDTYLNENRANRVFAENFQSLAEAAMGGSLERQTLLLDYAQRYIAGEESRETSIISRAQALLVSQTLLGALLALITALMGHAEIVVGWEAYVLLALLAYTVLQILLLTFNALRATAGLAVNYPGLSPLIRWLPEGERLMQKNMALATVKTYWDLNISNTWRANHFLLAQQCLRNIIITLALLVGTLLAVLFLTNAPPKEPNIPSFEFLVPDEPSSSWPF
jgi:hypothetical protein